MRCPEKNRLLSPARKPCLKSLARPACGHSQVNITLKPRHLIAAIVVGPCLNRLSARLNGAIIETDAKHVRSNDVKGGDFVNWMAHVSILKDRSPPAFFLKMPTSSW